MNGRRILFLSVVGAVVLSLAAIVYYSWFYAKHVLPYGLIIPVKVPAKQMSELRDSALQNAQGIHMDSLWVHADDSTEMFVYTLQADKGAYNSEQFISGCNVVLLHGIASGKEAMLPTAVWIAKHGGIAWVPDLRGHGRSGGKYCTYGLRESSDIVSLIDSIKHKTPKTMNLAVWGNSMGGSTALHTAAKDHRINLCISESAFSSLHRIASEFLDRKIGYHIPWMEPWAMVYAQEMANFDANKVDGAKALEHIECPVLLMHGTADAAVNIDHGKTIKEHIQHRHQRYIEFVGATHYGIRQANPEWYDREIRTAFELIQTLN